MHIAVEGVDAVGKTTTAKELANRLGMNYYSKSLHAMRDSSGVYDSFITLKDLLQDQTYPSDFGFRGSFVLGRVRGEDIISDRFMTSNFWAHGHGKHYDELLKLMETFGSPDLTVILYADPAVIADRMFKRDPNDKDIAKLPYIKEAYQTMLEFVTRTNLPYILFDTTELTFDAAVSALETLIRERFFEYSEPYDQERYNSCPARLARMYKEQAVMCFVSSASDDVLVIPEGWTEIRPFSLIGCDTIKEIVLPASMKRVSALSFQSMRSLESIVCSGRNDSYKSVDGVLYTLDGSRLIKYPQNRSANAYDGTGVAVVDNLAFYHVDKLQCVNLPDTHSVGFGAFLDAKHIQTLGFSDALSFIGQCALPFTHDPISVSFGSRIKFDSVNNCIINKQKQSIVAVFPGAEEICVDFPVKQLGPWACAFHNSPVLKIPDSVERIGPYAFACSAPMKISIPVSVSQIDDSILLNCSGAVQLCMQSLCPPEITSQTFELKQDFIISLSSNQAHSLFLEDSHWNKLKSKLSVRSDAPCM